MVAKQNKGYTLIEVILVIGLISFMTILTFQEKAYEFKVNKAKEVGSLLFQYNSAVTSWISNNPGAPNATHVGSNWLKPTSCPGGLSAVAYLPCSFPLAIGSDPIAFGELALQSRVTTTGTAPNQVTQVVTQTTPFKVDNGKVDSGLAGVAALTAASAIGGANTPVVMASENSFKSNPMTAAITMIASNNASADAWLRTDGSNTMNNKLTFNKTLGASFRIIDGVSRLQNIAGQVLALGNSGGATGAVKDSVVVDANTTMLGQLVVNNDANSAVGLDVRKGDIVAMGGDVVAGQSVKGKLFMDSDNNAFYVDPASTTQLNTLNTSGKITASGDITTMANVNVVGDIGTFGKVSALGRITTQEYFYSGATVNLGSGCSPNGLIGRQANGAIASCKNGAWSTSGVQMYQCPQVFSAQGVSSGPWASYGCVGQIWGTPHCMVSVYPYSQYHVCTPI